MSVKAKILIVEDQIPVGMMMTCLLTQAGCEIEVVTTGQKALEIVQNKVFDLIALDIGLPDINGLEVCRTLRQNPFFQTPIIFVSGRSLAQDIQEGFAVGAVDYIPKPFGEEFAPRLLAHLKIGPG